MADMALSLEVSGARAVALSATCGSPDLYWEAGRSAALSTRNERTSAVLAVHDLEIRVGARMLMSDVSFRVSDGDKIGLVGRNGAGKTTLTKVLAGDLLPADGKVDRSGELGYLPQDPRIGRPRDARAHPHPRRPRPRHARPRHARGRRSRWASTTRRSPRRPCKRYAQPHRAVRGARRLRGRGRGGIHRPQPLAARPHPRPAAQDALGRSAPPHRARPHPVLRRRDDDPRRADQPPRRRQRRVAARVPQELQGRADRHQPRRRARRRDGQPRLLPRREPPGHRRLQHELEELPAPAGGRRGAPQEGARQRREEGDGRCSCRPRASARRPRRPPPRTRWSRAPRRCSRASTRCARTTGSRSCGSRSPRRAARRRSWRPDLSKSYGSLEIFTDVDLAIDRGSKVVDPRTQRCRQDDAAAHPRGRRQARHGRASSPATASRSATTRRSTRTST